MLYLLQTKIPENIGLEKGLQFIYGIGKPSAKLSRKIYGFLNDAKVKNLRKHHRRDYKLQFKEFYRKLGTELKKVYVSNCHRLIEIHAYRGRQHKFGFPVRGQRTHTNAISQKRLYKRWIIETLEKPKEKIKPKKTNQKSQKIKPKKALTKKK